MLKHMKEVEKYVEITGFRNAKIYDVERFLRTVRKETPKSNWIQFFDAKLVASWQHLYFAVLNTLLSFKSARNISRSIPIEMMLYSSAQRQIRKAIQRIGVKSDSANIAVVIVGESPDSIRAILSTISKRIGKKLDETVLELQQEKIQYIREVFDITETELEAVMKKTNVKQALINLIIERMALLSTEH